MEGTENAALKLRLYWLRLLYLRHDFHNGYKYESCLNWIGDMDMARGKNGHNKANQASGNRWTTFVDIPLVDTSLSDIDAWFGDDAHVSDCLAGLLESGHRVGFSFNDSNNAAICSITCKSDESPNANMTFTSFAADWYTALKVALYKHFVVASQNWSSVSRNSSQTRFG